MLLDSRKGAGVKDKSVLFIGRQGDRQCEDIVAYLKQNFTDVQVFWSGGYGAELDIDTLSWRGDYIFCYRAHAILPESLIDRASIAAINFHPGPPEYRGIGCVNWALYDEAHTYGSTAHIMSAIVDAGPILDVCRFDVSPNASLEEVLGETYRQMAKQAKRVIGLLYSEGPAAIDKMRGQSRAEKWSDRLYSKRELEQLYQIAPSASSNEVAKVIRATVIGDWKPFIQIGPHRFDLKTSD